MWQPIGDMLKTKLYSKMKSPNRMSGCMRQDFPSDSNLDIILTDSSQRKRRQITPNLKGEEGGIPDHGAGFKPVAGDVKYKDLNGDKKIDNNDISAIGQPKYPLLSGNIQYGYLLEGTRYQYDLVRCIPNISFDFGFLS